ncbi:MAG TPA: prephenate dehydrogenase/arogenate dehydrogenase family protein [Pilimelia sp.]|nr:prephenate dehydrogenase/arogenate dehydrogenase family protein [Pilimelia sp.]
MDIAVLGLGLIGGSVLRALAGRGHGLRGYDVDPATRAAAAAAGGPAWRVTATVADAVQGAELTVLAVPLPALDALLGEVVAAGYGGLVTDVTSVQEPVHRLVGRHLGVGPARFVGGHPMAGRETSGFGAADADLFRDRAWVLCLDPDRPAALDDWLRLADLVTDLGARVVPATAAEHDRAVAAVSHVPHLVAAALATAAAEPLAGALAAGSFRDGTRVAASRPELVAAMCTGNAAAVAAALDGLRAALDAARTALDAPDPMAALRPWLAGGHAARSGWPARPGPAGPLPADVTELLGLGRAGGWVTGVAADRRTVTAVRPAPADPAPTAARRGRGGAPGAP